MTARVQSIIRPGDLGPEKGPTEESLAREFVAMPLRDFLALDDGAFRTLFRGSPIKRIKRARFLRNVCVALGNIGTAEDLPALEIAARDPDPLIAEHAQWAVRQIVSRSQNCADAPGA